MGQAHQPPLTTDLGQSTEQEPAKAPCLLDLAKDRLDDHLPPRVHRTTLGLSSASPASSLGPSRAAKPAPPPRGWSHCGAVAAPSRCADRNPHAPAPPPRAH